MTRARFIQLVRLLVVAAAFWLAYQFDSTPLLLALFMPVFPSSSPSGCPTICGTVHNYLNGDGPSLTVAGVTNSLCTDCDQLNVTFEIDESVEGCCFEGHTSICAGETGNPIFCGPGSGGPHCLDGYVEFFESSGDLHVFGAAGISFNAVGWCGSTSGETGGHVQADDTDTGLPVPADCTAVGNLSLTVTEVQSFNVCDFSSASLTLVT